MPGDQHHAVVRVAQSVDLDHRGRQPRFLRSPAEIAQLTDEDAGFIPCANLKDAVADDCAVRQ